MRDKRPTSKRRGQPIGADSDLTSQLASLLPGCGLEKLTDDEASQLLSFLNYLADESYADGFCAGQDAMAAYNSDMRRLQTASPTTEH